MLSILPFLTPAPQPSASSGVTAALTGLGDLRQKNTEDANRAERERAAIRTDATTNRQNSQVAYENQRDFNEKQRILQAKVEEIATRIEADDPGGKGKVIADGIRQAYGVTPQAPAAPPANHTNPNSPNYSYMPPAMPGVSPGADPAKAAAEAQAVVAGANARPTPPATTGTSPAAQAPAAPEGEDAALAIMQQAHDEAETAQERPEEEAGEPGPQPMPVSGPGGMPMPSPKAAELPTYRDTVTGNTRKGMDLGKLEAIDNQRMTAIVDGFGGGLINEADRPQVVAELAKVRGAFKNEDDAVKYIHDVILPRLGFSSGERRARIGAIHPPRENRNEPLNFDAGVRHAGRYMDDPGVKKSFDGYGAMKQLVETSDKDPTSVSDAVLQRSFAKALNSGALSEADAKSPQMYRSWQDQVADFVNQKFLGRLNPELRGQMLQVLHDKKVAVETEAQAAFESELAAAESALPEDGDYRKGFVSGMTRTFSRFPFFDANRVRRAAGVGGSSSSSRSSFQQPEREDSPAPDMPRKKGYAEQPTAADSVGADLLRK